MAGERGLGGHPCNEPPDFRTRASLHCSACACADVVLRAVCVPRPIEPTVLIGRDRPPGSGARLIAFGYQLLCY